MVIVQNLSKKFGTKLILDDFSYHFPKNCCIGIVGANGAGKTTFLNIIIGQEEQDSGKIVVPRDCVLGCLPQEPCENPMGTILQECMSGHSKLLSLQEKLNASLKKMEESYSEEVYAEYEFAEKEFATQGGYVLAAESKGILVGLGFENSQFDESPLLLSGGWRMRLELAKLLVNNPNFLILDEPTNHLDLPSLSWLERYLKSFKGTLLFVSHDKDFLNNISDVIMHISNGRVNFYSGNFDDFIEQKQANAEQVQKQKQILKKKQDSLQEFVDKFKSKATKAKQAQSKMKMIEKLKQLENRLDVDDTDKKALFKININQQSAKIVLDLVGCSIGYEENVLNKDLNLKVLRGDKIAVIGANGIGKSTLLKSIVGEIPFLSGEHNIGANVSIGYYAQSQLEMLDPDLSVLENVFKMANDVSYQQARSILGCLLITNEEVKKPVRVLSGGEKSKVAIAGLLAQRSNFLILDEPTNHLDMSSAEALAYALSQYEGTVLTVSHNRSFINSVATSIFKMDKVAKAELINF